MNNPDQHLRTLAIFQDGQWHTFAEIQRTIEATRGSLSWTLEKMMRAGEIEMQPMPRNSRRFRIAQSQSDSTTSTGRHRPQRPLYAAEIVPDQEVRQHPCIVGPLDVWRGKTWEDMPGMGEIVKKCNFFFWRRGFYER